LTVASPTCPSYCRKKLRQMIPMIAAMIAAMLLFGIGTCLEIGRRMARESMKCRLNQA